MTFPHAFRRRVPDHQYALNLNRTAFDFWQDLPNPAFSLDMYYHRCAIVIELALKAYLTQCGVTEEWQRHRIGHDLAEALRLAELDGLRPPNGVIAVVDLLHPHFMKGDFHHTKRQWPIGMERTVRMVVQGLLVQSLLKVHDAHPFTRLGRTRLAARFLLHDWIRRIALRLDRLVHLPT